MKTSKEIQEKIQRLEDVREVEFKRHLIESLESHIEYSITKGENSCAFNLCIKVGLQVGLEWMRDIPTV